MALRIRRLDDFLSIWAYIDVIQEKLQLCNGGF